MGVVRTGEDAPEVCPRCRRPTRRDFHFCPTCGERLQEVCSACRAALEKDRVFCANCGTHREARAVLFAAAEPVREQEAGVLPSEEDGLASVISERAEEHNSRGSELYENDEFGEAVREFSAAVSLVPTHPVYRTNLAVALSEMGEYERAVSEFLEALRLDPDNVGAYLQLGYTYQEMERLQDAMDAWRRVVELAPDSAEAEEARDAMESI